MPWALVDPPSSAVDRFEARVTPTAAAAATATGYLRIPTQRGLEVAIEGGERNPGVNL